jgi:hypothetical protein
MRVAILKNKARSRKRIALQRGRGLPRSPKTSAPTCASSKAPCKQGAGLQPASTGKEVTHGSWPSEALQAISSTIHNRQLTAEFIQKTVADYYKIKVADMHSKKRTRPVIARPRQVAMFLAKDLTPMSLPEPSAKLFGGRDHTTVLHAVRKISGERQQMTELNQQLHVLEQTLKG